MSEHFARPVTFCRCACGCSHELLADTQCFRCQHGRHMGWSAFEQMLADIRSRNTAER